MKASKKRSEKQVGLNLICSKNGHPPPRLCRLSRQQRLHRLLPALLQVRRSVRSVGEPLPLRVRQERRRPLRPGSPRGLPAVRRAIPRGAKLPARVFALLFPEHQRNPGLEINRLRHCCQNGRLQQQHDGRRASQERDDCFRRFESAWLARDCRRRFTSNNGAANGSTNGNSRSCHRNSRHLHKEYHLHKE
ncbi:hypothetical protein BDR26DRAFT_868226 [Obelidium mucronatum]|nr:hypothetical protein BDR26DRAFT_868226 [Obelidium mucronatum]